MAVSKSVRKAKKKTVGRSANKARSSVKKATKKGVGRSAKKAAKKTGKTLRRAAKGALNQLGGTNEMKKMAGRAAAAAVGQLAADFVATRAKKGKRAKKAKKKSR
jgi:hypothetical protein